MAVLLFIAGSTLVSNLTDIGLDTIAEAISDASLPILVLAFFVSMLPRFANAVALSALAPTKVPLGRLTVLQLAMSRSTSPCPRPPLRGCQHPFLPAQRRRVHDQVAIERSTDSPDSSAR